MAESTIYALIALAVALGAGITSIAGFGFMIIVLPFMVLLQPPKTALVLSLAIALTGAILQWIRLRKDVNGRLCVWLVLGGAAGIAVGGRVLTALDPSMLKVLIGIGALVAAVLTFIRSDRASMAPQNPGTGLLVVVGTLAGVLATTVGQSGVPVVALMSWARLDKKVVRSTLITFLVLINVMALTTLAYRGIFTVPIALHALTLVPAYLVGLALGDQVFRRASNSAHRRMVAGVLGVSAVVGIANSVITLM